MEEIEELDAKAPIFDELLEKFPHIRFAIFVDNRAQRTFSHLLSLGLASSDWGNPFP